MEQFNLSKYKVSEALFQLKTYGNGLFETGQVISVKDGVAKVIGL